MQQCKRTGTPRFVIPSAGCTISSYSPVHLFHLLFFLLASSPPLLSTRSSITTTPPTTASKWHTNRRQEAQADCFPLSHITGERPLNWPGTHPRPTPPSFCVHGLWSAHTSFRVYLLLCHSFPDFKNCSLNQRCIATSNRVGNAQCIFLYFIFPFFVFVFVFLYACHTNEKCCWRSWNMCEHIKSNSVTIPLLPLPLSPNTVQAHAIYSCAVGAE